ncbi:hypothetical protein LIER_31592 [Lithospermum erythrorhizon]|uniref:Uncharacterized protein n=1 Tax=Lithospermum erythrorhizon TaxID=34254 RepID=A0AAV3RTP3_LITER
MYISLRDATISGSRNGDAALYLWYSLSIKGKIGLEKESQKCLENASYYEGLLKGEGIVCFRNEWSLVVVFERPKDDEIVHQWQLSCEGDLAQKWNQTWTNDSVFLIALDFWEKHLIEILLIGERIWTSAGKYTPESRKCRKILDEYTKSPSYDLQMNYNVAHDEA